MVTGTPKAIGMRGALNIHPDSHFTAVTHIAVEASRPHTSQLALQYLVTGTTSELRMPPAATPARADELWRHTCFEAFVRPLRSAPYYEFNFAPSMQWAAYRFTDYRNGMSNQNLIELPQLHGHMSDSCYELRVQLDLHGLPGLADDAPWQIGLSAVIEETSGRKSYWALTHPPGEADFHHADCFALELPAA
jgi:hypothetical protein